MQINCSLDQVVFRSGSIDTVLSLYILPPVLIIGMCGNILTLIVFKDKFLASKSAMVFSTLAMFDLLFLMVNSVVIAVGAVQTLVGGAELYYWYYWIRNTMIAFSNWFSTASIWVVLIITIERIAAVEKPIEYIVSGSTLHIAINICWVASGSLALTFYQHFNTKVHSEPVCDGTRILIKFWSNDDNYMRFSVGLHILLAVAVPLLILILLNSYLINVLKTSRENILSDGSNERECAASSERRVTTIVCIIVACVCFTNAPSGCVAIYGLIFKDKLGRIFYSIAYVTNFLVIIGKVLNFFLFCASSSHFRSNLLDTFQRHGWRPTPTGFHCDRPLPHHRARLGTHDSMIPLAETSFSEDYSLLTTPTSAARSEHTPPCYDATAETLCQMRSTSSARDNNSTNTR